jgi:four helix bundle protein
MADADKTNFAETFRNRTKKFVVDNIRFYRTLPKTEEAKIIGRQLLRSSSSVGANYRAACRARSQAEFHSKLPLWLKRLMNLHFGWRF